MVDLCQKHKPQHPHHVKGSPRGRGSGVVVVVVVCHLYIDRARPVNSCQICCSVCLPNELTGRVVFNIANRKHQQTAAHNPCTQKSASPQCLMLTDAVTSKRGWRGGGGDCNNNPIQPIENSSAEAVDIIVHTDCSQYF